MVGLRLATRSLLSMVGNTSRLNYSSSVLLLILMRVSASPAWFTILAMYCVALKIQLEFSCAFVNPIKGFSFPYLIQLCTAWHCIYVHILLVHTLLISSQRRQPLLAIQGKHPAPPQKKVKGKIKPV